MHHHRSVYGVEVFKKGAGSFAMLTLGMDRSMLLWELHGSQDFLEESDWKNFKVKWSIVGLGGDILAVDLNKAKSRLAIGCGDKTVR